MPMTAVLAAGVGVRHGWGPPLRSASFRLESPPSGQPALGILIPEHGAGSAVVDLLSGVVSPSYGELRVLGEDMRTARGRAAVRARIGVAPAPAGPGPASRSAAWSSRPPAWPGCPRRDRPVLAAAILDRLS